MTKFTAPCFAIAAFAASKSVGKRIGFTGSSITIRNTGTYIVQFRAVDRVSNASAFAPATAGAANTACHT